MSIVQDKLDLLDLKNKSLESRLSD